MNLKQGQPIWLPSLFPCDHPELSGWRRYRSPHTGEISLRTQCLLCGMAQDIRPAGEVNPHDIAGYEPFDQGLTTRYLEARWQTFQADQQRLAMLPDRRSPRWYRDTYLKSPWWVYRRRRALADAGGLCERCRDKRAVHIHHLNYRRLFRERREDLRAVCWDCHLAADLERRRPGQRPRAQLRLLN